MRVFWLGVRLTYAFCIISIVMIDNAYAYLDPGTGSLLLSAMIGILSSLFYFFKSFYRKALGTFYVVFGLKADHKNSSRIVFYSEGKQYWNTFKPVIEALDKKGVGVTYLTSGENDEGLSYVSENVDAHFIGSGNRAYTYLNMLEADVCVMTTPGLDVLQIQRSPGVKHYSHIVHAPTDGIYKLFAFDYFDSVMCSGQHQIKSIRALEEKRNTKTKLLLETGCAYMDILADKLDEATVEEKTQGAAILIAPSWGQNGALTKFGAGLLRPLLEAGLNVIVRPHPQSYMVEGDLIENLQEQLSEFSNLVWDSGADGFASMNQCDVLVSDLSGIMFDFAFVFERPVISLQFELNLLGMDANDLPHELWELGMLDKIGRTIKSEDIEQLPVIVDHLMNETRNGDHFEHLRSENLFNFRETGDVAADQLLSIRNELQ